MPNPIMQMLQQSNPLSGVMNLFNTVKNSQNQSETLNAMAQNNPQLKQVMDYVNQNGGNAKQLFYDMCKQKNVDPESILSKLRN